MTRRDEVLEALRCAGEADVSGEDLARRLGISRVAVGKHVAALREAGYQVEAVPGRGYALTGVPDAPLPAEVRRYLQSALWERLEGGGVTGSTNADAAALARAGAPHGTAVLASRQTAGRGRLGRSWESPTGGVYVSAVLRPPFPPAALTGLPLAVAVGVAGALARFGIEAGVKWPNDLRLDHGKLAGVLLEMSAEADRTAWVVVGVGLNVRRAGSEIEGAAYLEDVAGAVGRAEAGAAVLDGIAEGYRLLVAEGFASVRAAFGERDVLAGSEVRATDSEGRLIAEGRAADVDGEGRLRVDTSDGVVAVAAGDVTLVGNGR
ncbi:MAG: biotin--[acetyl-CoA-carboxylase] ligase [Coriobacteriia bacterium]|nr:biotin--[acetyl-CoA-carboxylase] ligase [Coriobacteriia bacterium]